MGAWVRVSQQRLLSAPSDEAKLVVESDQPFRVAEVVKVEGEFVELRSVVIDREDLCATTSGIDEEFEVHFFTRLDALEPVLVTSKSYEFPDRSKLEFLAGVPIDQTGPEPTIGVGGGGNFIVPLEPDDIGRWFPAPSIPIPPSKASTWTRGNPLYYGERSIEPSGPPFEGIHDQQQVGEDRALLTFIDGCGRFTLWAERAPSSSSAKSGLYEMKGPRDAVPLMEGGDGPEKSVRDPGAGDGASRVASPSCGPIWDAPAGASLSWSGSDGAAGVTRMAVQLPKEAQEAEGKVCFTAAELAVCISSDQLMRTDPDCTASRSSPDVRVVEHTVSVGLDRDIVRRIGRAHVNELRHCYNYGLKKRPQLAGRVTIEFEIDRHGDVSSSKVQEVALTAVDEVMPNCLAKAIRRWKFPKPEGVESVSVIYPMEFSP